MEEKLLVMKDIVQELLLGEILGYVIVLLREAIFLDLSILQMYYQLLSMVKKFIIIQILRSFVATKRVKLL